MYPIVRPTWGSILVVDIIHQPSLYNHQESGKLLGVFQPYSEAVFPPSALALLAAGTLFFTAQILSKFHHQILPNTKHRMDNTPVLMVSAGIIKSKFKIWVQFLSRRALLRFFSLHFPALSYCAVLFTSPSSIRDLRTAEWRHTHSHSLTKWELYFFLKSFQFAIYIFLKKNNESLNIYYHLYENK